MAMAPRPPQPAAAAAAASRTWLSLLCCASLVAAQTLTPSNWSTSAAATTLEDQDLIQLTLDHQTPTSLLPLTDAHLNQSIQAGTLLVNTTNELSIGQTIAYISCDALPGYTQSDDIFNWAIGQSPKAVVLYSQTADYCNLTAYGGAFQYIYSLKSLNATQALISYTNSHSGRGEPDPVWSYIAPTDVPNIAQDNMNATSSDSPTNTTGQPSTQIAMVVLYVITAVITILFLAIIITGAIRAHRHPERYGLRAVAGGPRQNPARGLARAMLDSLPIVKFGGAENEQQINGKAADIELATSTTSGSTDAVAGASTEETSQAPRHFQSPAQMRSYTANAPMERPRSTEPQPLPVLPEEPPSATSPTGPTPPKLTIVPVSNPSAQLANKQPEPQSAFDVQCCSICTEDFERGQDLRVLPCDHRFHPACIDPWLLNISGTCPLCRIDLNPPQQEAGGEHANGEDEHDNNVYYVNGEAGIGGLAPPLGMHGAEGDETARRRLSVRRSIAIGLMGLSSRPENLSREERVAALRQLRSQNSTRRSREEASGVAATAEEEHHIRSRVRNVLNGRSLRRVRDSWPGNTAAASAAPASSAPSSVAPGSANPTEAHPAAIAVPATPVTPAIAVSDENSRPALPSGERGGPADRGSMVFPDELPQRRGSLWDRRGSLFSRNNAPNGDHPEMPRRGSIFSRSGSQYERRGSNFNTPAMWDDTTNGLAEFAEPPESPLVADLRAALPENEPADNAAPQNSANAAPSEAADGPTLEPAHEFSNESAEFARRGSLWDRRPSLFGRGPAKSSHQPEMPRPSQHTELPRLDTNTEVQAPQSQSRRGSLFTRGGSQYERRGSAFNSPAMWDDVSNSFAGFAEPPESPYVEDLRAAADPDNAPEPGSRRGSLWDRRPSIFGRHAARNHDVPEVPPVPKDTKPDEAPEMSNGSSSSSNGAGSDGRPRTPVSRPRTPADNRPKTPVFTNPNYSEESPMAPRYSSIFKRDGSGEQLSPEAARRTDASPARARPGSSGNPYATEATLSPAMARRPSLFHRSNNAAHADDAAGGSGGLSRSGSLFGRRGSLFDRKGSIFDRRGSAFSRSGSQYERRGSAFNVPEMWDDTTVGLAMHAEPPESPYMQEEVPPLPAMPAELRH